MSKINPENTAKLVILDHNNQIFKGTQAQDLAFYINSEQKIHIGPYHHGSNSVIVLDQNNVKINGDLYGINHLYSSNADLSNVYISDTCTGKKGEWNDLYVDNNHSSNVHADFINGQTIYSQDLSCTQLQAQDATFSNINVIDKVHFCNIDTSHVMVHDDITIEQHLISKEKCSLCNDTYCENIHVQGNIDLEDFIGFRKIS